MLLQRGRPYVEKRAVVLFLRSMQIFCSGLLSRRVHRDLDRIVLQRPDAAGADAGADAAADAAGGVALVFPRTVFVLDARDGFLGAGLEAHLAVATRAAADATRVVVSGVAEVAVVAALEAGRG